MNENVSTHMEGDPAVEAAERQVLGEANYQKVEVVHRFADTHPWFHPTLVAVGVLGIVAIFLFFRKMIQKRKSVSKTDTVQ